MLDRVRNGLITAVAGLPNDKNRARALVAGFADDRLRSMPNSSQPTPLCSGAKRRSVGRFGNQPAALGIKERAPGKICPRMQ